MTVTNCVDQPETGPLGRRPREDSRVTGFISKNPRSFSQWGAKKDSLILPAEGGELAESAACPQPRPHLQGKAWRQPHLGTTGASLQPRLTSEGRGRGSRVKVVAVPRSVSSRHSRGPGARQLIQFRALQDPARLPLGELLGNREGNRETGRRYRGSLVLRHLQLEKLQMWPSLQSDLRFQFLLRDSSCASLKKQTKCTSHEQVRNAVM